MTEIQPAPPRYQRGDVEFGRALGFFDATFAVAMTFLVTTLDPGDDGWHDWSRFYDVLGPQLLAFTLSFAVVASYWWGNHQFIGSLRALSPRLILGNIVMLAFVVLVPFTSEALGETHRDTNLPTVVYAVNIALVSLSAFGLFTVARADRLFREPPTPAYVRSEVLGLLGVPAVFLASIPVTLLVSIEAGQLTWLALLVVGPLAARSGQGRRPRAPERPEPTS